jgi:hypothetical protein
MSAIVTNVVHAPVSQVGDTKEEHNAFLIILYMYLRNIKSQDGATDAGLNKLLLLMSQFENQKDIVSAKQTALQALIDSQTEGDMSKVQAIQAAMSDVQAEQAKMFEIRGEMNQVFKVEIDPCQEMIRQACAMFGAMLKNYLITERTR